MIELITLKLSTKNSGIVYEDISVEKAIELTQCNIDIQGKGPRKITIDWTKDDEGAVVKSVEVPDGSCVVKTDDNVPAPMTEPKNKLHNMHQASLDDENDIMLSEIEKIEKYEFTTPKFITIEANLYFAETADGRIAIKYAGTKINTTWDNLIKLEQSIADPIPRGGTLLEENDTGNRRTAIIKFINKMRTNKIKQGDGIELFNKIFKHVTNPTDKKKDEDVDPDADFRPTGVGSSVYPPSRPTGQDFGDGGS